ncbi:universal stress protein [Leifsonia kafniensis]|uniref:Universal stress protein n=1 Tax=Leifsonia kafniensis TaxID=475957 RepID=A0ABP7K813_9MICO
MRILVGYTATDAGADALALGVRLARSGGASLDVVIVLNSEERATLVPTDPGYEHYLSKTAAQWLREAAASVPADVAAQTHIVYAESFAQGLLDAARDDQADMIVVGAARNGLLGRFTVGSVASALLHASHVPVALAPEGTRELDVDKGVSRVTCAVGTKIGAEVLMNTAIAVARTTDAPLRLVSLVALDLPGGLDDPLVSRHSALHAREVLDYASAHLPDEVEVSAGVASGDSIEEAVRTLHWDPAEIVLVGSSRLAKPNHLFLGSIAAKMLRELPVPMIVVPRDSTVTVGK